jgi:hypothetical protein
MMSQHARHVEKKGQKERCPRLDFPLAISLNHRHQTKTLPVQAVVHQIVLHARDKAQGSRIQEFKGF